MLPCTIADKAGKGIKSWPEFDPMRKVSLLLVAVEHEGNLNGQQKTGLSSDRLSPLEAVQQAQHVSDREALRESVDGQHALLPLRHHLG